MILDADLVFSNKQAVTATAESTNTLDLGVAGDAIGQELTIHVVVDTAFAALTSLTVSLETSANNSTWTTVLSGPAVPRASLTKGASIFCVRVPQGLSRYVRMKYTVGGSNATAGKVTAFASKDL
jgi:hypothetical protein